jgi:hypothetical protein
VVLASVTETAIMLSRGTKESAASHMRKVKINGSCMSNGEEGKANRRRRRKSQVKAAQEALYTSITESL